VLHDTVEAPPDTTIIKLNGSDLWKLGISSNHIRALLILLAFLFSAYQNFIQLGGEEARGVWKWVKTVASSNALNTAVVLFILALILSLLISMAGVVLKYYHFKISRSEKGYHISSGLINLKEKLVPFKKVQYISWSANWLRQQMSLYLLQFHATGANEDVADRQEIKVPATQPVYIEQLASFYHPLLHEQEYTAIGVSPLYVVYRTLIAGILPALPICGIGYFFWQEYALLSLMVIPITLLQCWLFQKKFRLFADHEALQLRKGVYGTMGLILEWNKVQQVIWQQSIYQRKKNLATVQLHTAGGIITIPYIKMEHAMRICNHALYRVESADKPW
jgi:putative membrane protein